TMVGLASGLVDDALHAENFEAAAQLAKTAQDMALKITDASLRKDTKARVQKVKDAQTAWEAAKKAESTLAKTPGDAAANSLLGEYLALSKGDWVKALPYLAKGSDAGLKNAAAQELAGVATTEKMVAVGDVWAKLSQSAE